MINIGFLVSHDYAYLETSIPLVYKYADKIVLAIDINRKTWSGNSFKINDSFFDWIKTIDKDFKIKIYEDNFYVPELTPLENDTRERMMLAKKMGKGWCIQIDADEFFVNFEPLIQLLKDKKVYLENPSKKPVTIYAYWLIIYKKLEGGYLFVSEPKPFPIATNFPDFKLARKSNQFRIYTSNLVFHQAYGRGEEGLRRKLKNWGHSVDFDLEKYMTFWKSVNETNYKNLNSFHPYMKNEWKSLSFAEGRNIPDVLNNINKSNLSTNKLHTLKHNIFQKIKHFRLK